MMGKRNFVLLLKGCAMGAADVIPGVSGGTIAFITGIYEELVGSIKSIDLEALRFLFTLKFRKFWQKINGSFLFSLVLGILISIFSLAKLMTYLLEHQPVGTWSFFFGLIVASCFWVSREIKKWRAIDIILLVAGAAAIYAITVLYPVTTPETWWFIILSGAIAICAMILPGISGAFILLLLGKYEFIIGAVAGLRMNILLLFAIGVVAGIISFSHVLSWLLSKYRNATIATMIGFMVGSLYKIWPWKEVLETYTDSHGAVKPLYERSVLPSSFAGEPRVGTAIIMFIAGFLLIYIIEFIGKKLRGTAP